MFVGQPVLSFQHLLNVGAGPVPALYLKPNINPYFVLKKNILCI